MGYAALRCMTTCSAARAAAPSAPRTSGSGNMPGGLSPSLVLRHASGRRTTLAALCQHTRGCGRSAPPVEWLTHRALPTAPRDSSVPWFWTHPQVRSLPLLRACMEVADRAGETPGDDVITGLPALRESTAGDTTAGAHHLRLVHLPQSGVAPGKTRKRSTYEPARWRHRALGVGPTPR